MAQCQWIKNDGDQCGANAVTGSDYCRHHPPDDEPADSEKVVEAEGKAIDEYEGKWLRQLDEEVERAKGPNARVKAIEVGLRHLREREG